MKIQTSAPARASAIRRSDQNRPGSGKFADALSDGTAAGGSVSGGGQIGGVNSLLAIQEVEDRGAGRRRAVDRAEDLLEQLDELRTALLLGRIPQQQIERLVSRLKQQGQGLSDPKLAETIAEIELRAAVELAKLEARSAT